MTGLFGWRRVLRRTNQQLTLAHVPSALDTQEYLCKQSLTFLYHYRLDSHLIMNACYSWSKER